MTHRIKIKAVEREFDSQRYAELVIALAKQLAERNTNDVDTERTVERPGVEKRREP